MIERNLIKDAELYDYLLSNFDSGKKRALLVLTASVATFSSSIAILASNSPEEVVRAASMLNAIAFGGITLSLVEFFKTRSRGNQVIKLAQEEGLNVRTSGRFKRRVAA